jgi:dihydrofolate reductase
MILSLIAAADENNVIGGENKLLWDMPRDMKRFIDTTKGKPIIMGRKTYESIGRPLPGRRNIIISRQNDLEVDGCEIVGSLNEAIELASQKDPEVEIFVIGGGEIYKQAMPFANRIYLTRIHGMFQGDTKFPEISKSEWKEVEKEFFAEDNKNPHACTFLTYKRRDC